MTIGVLELKTQIGAAVRRVKEHITDLRRRIADARKHVTTLRSVYVSSDVCDARALTIVRRRGAAWREKEGFAVLLPMRYTTKRPETLLQDDEFNPASFSALCARDEQAAVRILRQQLEALGYEPGPSPQAYDASVTHAERELAELERAEESAVDAAIAEGVDIGHRSEVIRRRSEEESQRRRDERLNADRAAAQDSINRAAAQRAEPPPAVGRSNYLAACAAQPLERADPVFINSVLAPSDAATPAGGVDVVQHRGRIGEPAEAKPAREDNLQRTRELARGVRSVRKV